MEYNQKSKKSLFQPQTDRFGLSKLQRYKYPFSQQEKYLEKITRPLDKLSEQKKNTKTLRNIKEGKKSLPLTETYENIVNTKQVCENIKSKKFPIDSSLKIRFIFEDILLDNKSACIISLKSPDGKNFVLLSSDINRMYLMLLFICKYKIKPGFIRYSI